jgi:hypothetical protein
VDAGFKGSKFTWCNKQEGEALAKKEILPTLGRLPVSRINVKVTEIGLFLSCPLFSF